MTEERSGSPCHMTEKVGWDLGHIVDEEVWSTACVTEETIAIPWCGPC